MSNGTLTSTRFDPGAGGGNLEELLRLLEKRRDPFQPPQAILASLQGQPQAAHMTPSSLSAPDASANLQEIPKDAAGQPDLQALYQQLVEKYSMENRRAPEQEQQKRLSSLGKREALAGLGQGIARIAGGQTMDPSQFFAGERKRIGEETVGRFDTARKRELEDLLGTFKAGRDVFGARKETTEFTQEQEDRKLKKQIFEDSRDPNSELSKRARTEFESLLGRSAPPTMSADAWERLRPGFLQLELNKLKTTAKAQEAKDKAAAKDLSATAQKTLAEQSKSEQAARSAQMDAADALELLDAYSGSSWFGTGLAAGAKRYVGPLAQETQNLEAAFKRLEVQRVIETAREAGARSADSDAERRAIIATAPKLIYDDDVNRRIIFSMMSQSARGEYLARKRQEHIAANGSLAGFNPTAIDESITTVYNTKEKKVMVVPKANAADYTQGDWVNIKDILFPQRAVTPRTAIQPSTPQIVRMRSPEGAERDVPIDQVDKWKAKGAKVVQ